MSSRGVGDAEAQFVATTFEERAWLEFPGDEILREKIAVGMQLHGNGYGKTGDTAIKEKFLGLNAIGRFDLAAAWMRFAGRRSNGSLYLRAAAWQEPPGSSMMEFQEMLLSGCLCWRDQSFK